MNNYYKVVNDFLTIAKQNPFIKGVEYGNIYEQHNSGNIEYNTFTLTQGENSSQTENEITYNFIAFVTDRLLEDKSNLLYVQSSCKTILDTILTTFKERHSGWSIDTETFSFWEEKFNDYCAGCFVNFSVTMPIEFSCVGVAGGGGNTIDITSNGTYDVTNYDTAIVNVHSTDVFNYFTLYPSNYIYANYLDLSTEIVANVKFTGDEDFYFCSDEKGLIGLYFDAKENETYAWWDGDRLALHFHKRDWDKGFYKIQFKAGRLQIGYLTWTLDSKSSTTSFDPLYFGYYKEKTSPMEIEYITISNQYGAAYDYRPKITDEYAELVEVISGKIADIRTVYSASEWNITEFVNNGGKFSHYTGTDMPNVDWDKVTITNADYMFDSMRIEHIYAKFLTCSVFNNPLIDTNLNVTKTIDIEMPIATRIYGLFSYRGSSSVKSVIVRRLGENDEDIVGAIHLDFYPNLTKSSLIEFFVNLGTRTGKHKQPPITLGETNYNKLTEEDIKIATDKGWTVIQ